jgi:hypothetical protein
MTTSDYIKTQGSTDTDSKELLLDNLLRPDFDVLTIINVYK